MKIEKSTLDFFEDLRKNNYREWFQANRPRYEAAKANFIEVVAAIMEGINEFDPTIGMHDVKQLMYRINRDVRFSPNKDPYKIHFGAVLNEDGNRRSPLSGYYIHVEPQGSVVSCGIYMPDAVPGTLPAIRDALDSDWANFSKIIGNKAFKKDLGDLCREDDVLTRVPRGFSPDSPAAEYLKLKHFYVWKRLPDELLTSEDYIPEALRLIKLMKPLNDYFNRIIKSI